MTVLLGCIADDFTGGTDLSEVLVKNGMRTVQILGIPDYELLLKMKENTDAFVVSLKIRTVPPQEAVSQALAALAVLQEVGCTQYFWKYCSTFDSTSKGNIGPVADALQDALETKSSIVCPAFPENGRTIYQGHLFVYDKLLHNTHMRHHPLTPMGESNVKELLQKQTSRPCGLLPLQNIRKGLESVKEHWGDLIKNGISHVIADTVISEDLYLLGELCADHKLITGGSGIARGLPSNYRKKGLLKEKKESPLFEGKGVGIVLAGSCSAVTLDQIQSFLAVYPGFMIEPMKLISDQAHYKEAVKFAQDCLMRREPCLIYSSAQPDQITQIQKSLGREYAGKIVESAFSNIALEMAEKGVRRFIIAGGETAGAVMSAFDIRAIKIGKSIAPGVPWVATLEENPLFFALKSGNFGAPDFFLTALGLK